MKKVLCLIGLAFGSAFLSGCNGGGSSSSGGGGIVPTPDNPMPSVTVYNFSNGNPLTGSSNRIQNTINPTTQKPLYQLNSSNYGNNALIESNGSWIQIPFGPGTTAQNGILDMSGNIDMVSNGLLSIYQSSSMEILGNYSFDNSITMSYGLINNSGTNVIGFTATGVYSCPVNGVTGSCVNQLSTGQLPKRIQTLNNTLYASFVSQAGDSYITATGLDSGTTHQYNLALPTGFQIDEFVPDGLNPDIAYVYGIKTSAIYMSVFKCTLSSGGCSLLYDNVTSISDSYSQMSADSNSLYFMRTQNSNLTLTYSIVKVSK
jgi:hypothetical protein